MGRHALVVAATCSRAPSSPTRTRGRRSSRLHLSATPPRRSATTSSTRPGRRKRCVPPGDDPRGALGPGRPGSLSLSGANVLDQSTKCRSRCRPVADGLVERARLKVGISGHHHGDAPHTAPPELRGPGDGAAGRYHRDHAAELAQGAHSRGRRGQAGGRCKELDRKDEVSSCERTKESSRSRARSPPERSTSSSAATRTPASPTRWRHPDRPVSPRGSPSAAWT